MSATYLSSMAGLGVLGFDPINALVAIASLLAGVRVRHVGYFLAVTLAGTLLLGCALAVTSAPALASLPWGRWLRTRWYAAAAEIAVAVGLLVWSAVRIRSGPRPAGERSRDNAAGKGAIGQVLLGLLLVAAWLIDPFFLAAAVVSGATHSMLAVVVGQLIWLALSQVLTVVLVAGMALWSPDRIARRISQTWDRWARGRFRLVNLVIVTIAAILVADAAGYLITGRYLLGSAS